MHISRNISSWGITYYGRVALYVNSQNVSSGCITRHLRRTQYIPPHNSSIDSHVAATSSIDELVEDIKTTLSSGDTGTGVPAGCDDASESFSFFYDPGLAASGTDIASYKTESLSDNSHKSRCNFLPRHKYTDHGYLKPQGPGSLGHTLVPKVCESIDPRNTTTTMASLCRPS